jgi:hypothetical protein
MEISRSKTGGVLALIYLIVVLIFLAQATDLYRLAFTVPGLGFPWSLSTQLFIPAGFDRPYLFYIGIGFIGIVLNICSLYALGIFLSYIRSPKETVL